MNPFSNLKFGCLSQHHLQPVQSLALSQYAPLALVVRQPKMAEAEVILLCSYFGLLFLNDGVLVHSTPWLMLARFFWQPMASVSAVPFHKMIFSPCFRVIIRSFVVMSLIGVPTFAFNFNVFEIFVMLVFKTMAAFLVCSHSY